MSNALHSEIKALAGTNPAAYLSIDFVQTLAINKMLLSIAKVQGVEIPSGQQLLSATLDSATFSAPPSTSARFVKPATSLPNQVGLALSSTLTVVVSVFVKGDKAKLISTVTVVVTDLVIAGSYESNTITFEGVDFSPKANVLRDPLADQRLKAAGIDPLEAARVEGLIAYSAVNNALSSSLAQRKTILLSESFPTFDFGAIAQLVPLDAGRFLGIIPSAFIRNDSAVCKCATNSDIPTSGSSNTITVPPNPTVGTKLGGVTIGGPLPQHIDPLKDLGIRHPGTGVAGVYLPKRGYNDLTVHVMPAIAVHASDNGFIGFNAYGTVAFSGFRVALDAAKGGIIVGIDMEISIQVICTLDIGCGLRLPIGYAIIQPASGSNANLEMGFYPAVDPTGTLKLRGVLQKVDMGQYVAVIIGIGTALKIIGVTAWIGFLIDVVLSAIVSYKLPIVLRDEVVKYLAQNEWKLLSFGETLFTTYGPRVRRLTAPFDVDGDTLLASIGFSTDVA
jgi:hypothetical protein